MTESIKSSDLVRSSTWLSKISPSYCYNYELKILLSPKHASKPYSIWSILSGLPTFTWTWHILMSHWLWRFSDGNLSAGGSSVRPRGAVTLMRQPDANAAFEQTATVHNSTIGHWGLQKLSVSMILRSQTVLSRSSYANALVHQDSSFHSRVFQPMTRATPGNDRCILELLFPTKTTGASKLFDSEHPMSYIVTRIRPFATNYLPSYHDCLRSDIPSPSALEGGERSHRAC